MIDQETGLRAYLLTDSAIFLDPYQRAAGVVDAKLEALRALVADNPAQVSRQQALRAISVAWRTYARELLRQQEAGGDPRAEQIQLRGKALMDDFRREAADFIRIEEQLRGQRIAEAQRATRVVQAQ